MKNKIKTLFVTIIIESIAICIIGLIPAANLFILFIWSIGIISGNVIFYLMDDLIS